jgi:hypothetical protein
MNLLQVQQRIADLMALFMLQVKSSTAIGHLDINRVAENVLIPLFVEVYGYKDLKNLNYSEGSNYPGVDLGDDVARVAVQVTATPTSEKIKQTLRQFVKHRLYDQYDALIIYILAEKQKSYSASGYDEIIQNRFAFAVDRDILDYRDLLEEISDFQIDRAIRVQNILEANFGDASASLSRKFEEKRVETVSLNLLEVTFPSTLYIADIAIEDEPPTNNSTGRRRRFGKPSTRERVQAALKQFGLTFASDWECHESQIIAFHDLSDENLPLSKVIDQGTVTSISPGEYYGEGEEYEDVFKSLLRRCLQQKLFSQHVLWQHEAHLFIFADENGEAIRKESWWGKLEAERTVYDRLMKKDKPTEILRCRHFAFGVQFKHIGDRWYVVIQPDWFFSYDGYKRSSYHEDDLDWIKRHENNGHVFNHVRFITYFLRVDKPSLFDKTERRPYRFLSFGELVSFDSAPFLDDKAWNPSGEDEEEKEKPESSDSSLVQGSLDL